MKKYFFAFLFLLIGLSASNAQSSFNLDFEKVNAKSTKPIGWDLTFKSGRAKGFLAQLDAKQVKSGKYSLTIFPDPKESLQDFGACDYIIPAIYQGKEIELRGFLKTKDVSKDGYAGLWMRLDGEYGSVQFNNMSRRKIVGTHDWKEYTIKLPLCEEVQKIHVGGVVIGNGQIWIDDLRLYIDGKPIEKAPKKKIKTYPAKADSAFANGSKINIAQLTPQQIDGLSLLAKVWGFVKYHHPQVAQGNHNMDSELFRVMPLVLASKTPQQRDQVLVNWIQKFGKLSPCNHCPKTFPKDAKQLPDLGWTKSPALRPDLSNALQHLFANRNQGEHYYIGLYSGVRNPRIRHEAAYQSFQYPDTGYRLLALFRYWNIIQYFFPYKYAIGRDWKEILPVFIPQFVNAQNALDYHLVVRKMTATIEDSHSFLREKHQVLRNYWGNFYAPVQAKFIDGQAVITNYYDQSLGEKTGLKKGDIIVAIDGKTIPQVLKERMPFTAASNQAVKFRGIGRHLLRGTTNQVRLKIKRGTQLMSLKIDRYPRNKINRVIDWDYKNPSKSYSLLHDKVGYIHLGKLKRKELPQAFQLFKNTQGLVIDVRNYPSDFPIYKLSSYLLPQKKHFVTLTHGDPNTPGLFTFNKNLYAGSDNPAYYKGKVIILVNEITQSSAEFHTMAFRTSPNALVIGSTTSGADGNVSRFPLPGGLQATITGIGVYYPNRSETQRVGIVPDIVVKPTLAGIKAGKDEVLEKALELIFQKK